MMTLRPAAARGHADHGWLVSHHTFSFANYHDARHMGVGALRVLNDDRVAPGRGFGAHPHRDMEILSVVLDGELAHRDSTGTGATIRPGWVQHLRAGRGVVHSEHNASAEVPVHFLQIWLLPQTRGAAPAYAERDFSAALARGGVVTIASPDGRDGSLVVDADAVTYRVAVDAGQAATVPLGLGRGAWVHVARGEVRVGDHTLGPGDGASVIGQPTVDLVAASDADVLVFDVRP